jgi:hypothetical protein
MEQTFVECANGYKVSYSQLERVIATIYALLAPSLFNSYALLRDVALF